MAYPGNKVHCMPVPADIREYLSTIVERTRAVLGEDLLGAWLIGSAAQDAYQHGVSDVDVLVVSAHRWPPEQRHALGQALAHPALPCPTVGLEFVWYALPDLTEPADPVRFQLNVNGGLDRRSTIQLEPGDGPNYWSVLDLAAARQIGVPVAGSDTAAAVIPEVPTNRIHLAIRESLAWHDSTDAGSPNRVLNLARLLVLLDRGLWLSKLAGAEATKISHPELAECIDEALRARAEKRWMDASLAEPLSAELGLRLSEGDGTQPERVELRS